MNEERANTPRPRATLRAGVIVTCVGVAVLVLTSNVIPNLLFFTEPRGQALLGLINVLLDAIRFVAVPLGCALIGAGIVMRYAWSLHAQARAQNDRCRVP